MYLSTSGIITFMAWNGVRFSFPVIMPDCPLAVIPEDESAFVADRTVGIDFDQQRVIVAVVLDRNQMQVVAGCLALGPKAVA